MATLTPFSGNELVEFTTFFSIGYAICIIPSQLVQTRIRSSVFLPVCEIIWGALTLATYASKNAKTVYALRFFLGMFESTSWPGLVAIIFNWCMSRPVPTSSLTPQTHPPSSASASPSSVSPASRATCSSESSKQHCTKT